MPEVADDKMAEASEEVEVGELLSKVTDILAAHTIGFQCHDECLEAQSRTHGAVQNLLRAQVEQMDAHVAYMATHVKTQEAQGNFAVLQ